MDSFWRDSWKSFKAVFGPILAGAAFVLALLGPVYAPAAPLQIGMIWVAVLALTLLTILLTAVNMVIVARSLVRGRLSRVLQVFVTALHEGQAEAVTTLVLGRSDLFGVNILVTIYYVEHLGPGRDDMFERQIGIGLVTNVQQNGLVQVTVLEEIPAHAGVWQRVRNREATVLSQLVVKPSISPGEAGIRVRFNE